MSTRQPRRDPREGDALTITNQPAAEVDLLRLVTINAAPQIASLLAQRQVLQSALTDLACQLKAAEQAVGALELRIGAALARGGLTDDWAPGVELAEARRQIEDLEVRQRIIALAAENVSQEIETTVEQVKGDIAMTIRERGLCIVGGLMEMLGTLQHAYGLMAALQQDALRLLADRYLVPAELLDARLDARREQLKAWHTQESAVMARLTATAHETQVQQNQ